ncbi:NADP-dependent oxidoreductase domain-containing protein [Papiliotrema laurentii]|uniref:NADP-dependent oxidoreductase domain-containing protein n=1 Tax=Papiliotrema laurentii TaxID=5418 RepID=A0AAD9CTW6_PAPLA|nr:NADP-dependent oxidoreductase domain-containing protein [Papiliotrema laurentii]
MPRAMPRIMYGTAWKKERTTDLVVQAIRAGFRGVDTACQPKHYREDLVGAALKRVFSEGLVKREDLFIQTKFTSIDGQDTSQPLPYDPSLPVSQQVEQSISKSLSNLGVEYIDSVVLHSPLRTQQATLEAYQTLEGFVDAGKIITLGISNIYDPKLLEWLLGKVRVKVGVVQNRWYEGNGFDWKVYELCQKHSIRYQSFWTLTGNPTLLDEPTLLSLAERAGFTPEQAIYRLCQIWNITPLCGSTTLSHVQEALAVERDTTFNPADPQVKELWSLMHR